MSARRRGVWGLFVGFVAGSVALRLADLVLDGLSLPGVGGPALAVLVVALVGVVLRPLLARLALALGWVGVFLLAVLGDVIVVWVGLMITPGVEIDGFGDAFVAAWIVALALTVARWSLGIADDDELVARIVRFGRRRFGPVAPNDTPGVVFVQLDGVSEPLLRFALLAGNLPTLDRWVRSGSHAVTGWTTCVPTTTPVSQAGILHGHNEGIPAFRWWEKDGDRLLVANHPADAAVIEERISNGRGLLVDDGASVSNIFTGDAEHALLTMAGVGADKVRGLGPSRDWVGFFLAPYGFFRLVLLALGEMAKERFQARREVRTDRRPRGERPWSYVGLRAATNVVQRQWSTVLVAEQMLRGRSSIYVDYVDYDEVAHHAGIARPESLATIEGVDRVLGQLEAVAAHAPRPYRFVVLSDHGQSQGPTFADAHEPLEDLVRRLMGGREEAVGDVRVARDDEAYGPLNTLLTEAARGGGLAGRMTRSALGDHMAGGSVAVQPSVVPDTEVADDAERPELVVVGSGNLGAIWFPREPGRLTLEDLQGRWPEVVPGLVEHPGIGFVVVDSAAHGPVALGRGGVHHLVTGVVEGVDPLAPFGPRARPDFLRVAGFANAPDLYLNSTVDPDTLEVHAFEGLVGCHGGLGGWQDRGVLVHPADWPVDEAVVGAEALHQQLVRWLEALGHRSQVAAVAE